MNKYYQFIKFLSDNNENHVFLNSEEKNMPIVFDLMFHQSKTEFRIFAGNLCNYTTDSPQYIEAMSDYIESGGKLRILLNSFEEDCAYESKLFRRLYMYIKQGKDIEIRKTNQKPFITKDGKKVDVHFSVGDLECYRMEDDIEKRTAICNMHDPEMAQKIAELFDNIFNNYHQGVINLKPIFERR